MFSNEVRAIIGISVVFLSLIIPVVNGICIFLLTHNKKRVTSHIPYLFFIIHIFCFLPIMLSLLLFPNHDYPDYSEIGILILFIVFSPSFAIDGLLTYFYRKRETRKK